MWVLHIDYWSVERIGSRAGPVGNGVSCYFSGFGKDMARRRSKSVDLHSARATTNRVRPIGEAISCSMCGLDRGPPLSQVAWDNNGSRGVRHQQRKTRASSFPTHLTSGQSLTTASARPAVTHISYPVRRSESAACHQFVTVRWIERILMISVSMISVSSFRKDDAVLGAQWRLRRWWYSAKERPRRRRGSCRKQKRQCPAGLWCTHCCCRCS